MVGPWQTPLADVAVTATTMASYTGEAMAMGERTPIALLDAPASGRMAIGECLTNMAASHIGSLQSIKLSANWMVAAGEDGEDANLYDTVTAVGMELCPALGICIPVGKDSMSMRTTWNNAKNETIKQVSPLSLLITGFSTVEDVRKTLTPDFKQAHSTLLLFDLGEGKNRMGASSLAQCFNQVGDTPPDLDNPELFKQFFACIQSLIAKDLILSYHDRSDGGLYITVTEMAIAGRKGYDLKLDALLEDDASDLSIHETLFNEELGAVLEIESDRLSEIKSIIESFRLSGICHSVGKTTTNKNGRITHQSEIIYENTITELNRAWSELSFTMQSLRDNSDCAKEAYDLLLDETDQGIIIQPTFDPDKVPNISKREQPKIAIFREQGINGQNEMA